MRRLSITVSRREMRARRADSRMRRLTAWLLLESRREK